MKPTHLTLIGGTDVAPTSPHPSSATQVKKRARSATSDGLVVLDEHNGDTDGSSPAGDKGDFQDVPGLTVESLPRRVRALQLGARTLGAVLDEAIAVFEESEDDVLERSSKLSDQLGRVGIWLIHPTEDDDPPLFGQVVYADRLVKSYPALRKCASQLVGLELHRSVASA